jgi:hypothetical protein
MTHEFSHNPIKLRVVDIKTGEWKKSYVFIGDVPINVKNELFKLEKAYNKHGKLAMSTVLKKFYGKNWQYRLGVVNSTKKVTGGNEGVEVEMSDVDRDLIVSMGLDPDDGKQVTGGNEGVEFEMPDADEIAEFDLGDEVLDDEIIKTTAIEVTDEEMEQAATDELAHTATSTDVLIDHIETENIGVAGGIEFVFKTKVYPNDNLLTFKQKIYLEIGIPIYRQHLWFKHNNKSYPVHYNITLFKNSTNVDIEQLIAFYTGKKSMNEIEGIPVNMDYYKNKDFIHISANDTFNLLYTNYEKYGTTEYFVVDANDLMNPNKLYSRLKRDRYQLDVIYYGFVVIYFPVMTYPVFMDYLKNENAIEYIYMELRHDKSYLRKKFNLAALITDESYAAQDDSKDIRKNLFSSITHTTISIKNYNQDIESLLVLRNIFDLIQLSSTMTYCKAHLIHENRAIMLKKSYFNESEPREQIPIHSLMLKIKTNPDTNEYMKLIIFKNGNYIVKTNWREENHMDFNKITKDVSASINPIIKTINKMGNKVKHYEVEIADLNKDNIQFTRTNFVFYYEDNVTEGRFNVFKNVLHDFADAGFLIPKENVVLGEEYFFKEGMYKFDASRIEKAISLNNYYDHLSNGIVKHKWGTVFERTQLFSVISVASKIKLSISGIRNDTEIHFFYIFLIGMLHIYHRNAESLKQNVNETVQNKSKRRLKNLKMQDPLLYDFKKIYKSNVIYSKICQKPYQPIILNDNEYKNMSKEKRSNAIKYWNFTKEKPVWYTCPNPKYPYIKFIIKQHPKDYCIPCCKKIAMNENVNPAKQSIHETCMKMHKFTGEKISLTKGSHYIATYGKDIEVGRLSRLPEHTLEPLFFDTYSPDAGIDPECATADGYYLFGVDQNTANSNRIGYLYCLVHSLNMSVDDFLADCRNKLKSDPSKFRILLDGMVGMYFSNNTELIEKISILNTDTFMENRYETVPWNNLFMSIAYYFYGINTVKFADQHREQIDMVLPKGLKTADEMFPNTHKNLVVLMKNANYYPVYLLNTNIFKRTGIVDTRLFLNESGLITTIQAVVRRHFDGIDHEKIRSRIDLTIIKDFVSKHPHTKISGYYINYANLCYAVSIYYNCKECYMPIHASHYPLDKNIKMLFEPFDIKKSIDANMFLKLVDVYNKWVDYESKKADVGEVDIFPKIVVERWISVKAGKQVIGFLCRGVNYYVKPMSEASAQKTTNAEIQYMMYDPVKINQLIFNIKNGKTKNIRNRVIDNKLQQSTYQYYMYELVILQFISIFNRQKNIPLRRNLLAVLAKTNFDKSMDKIREFITGIDDVDDKQAIKNIVGRFINDHHNKRRMIDDINKTFFNFDRVNLEKLKVMPYNDVVKELHKMAKTFVEIGDIKSKNFQFPNIIMPCNQLSRGDTAEYCFGNKFIMQKTQMGNILDIIAHDITNPSKWKWIFNSAFIEKSVNYFKFIRRGSETIKVVFL